MRDLLELIKALFGGIHIGLMAGVNMYYIGVFNKKIPWLLAAFIMIIMIPVNLILLVFSLIKYGWKTMVVMTIKEVDRCLEMYKDEEE